MYIKIDVTNVDFKSFRYLNLSMEFVTDTKDPCFPAFPVSPPTSHSSLHETQLDPLDLHDG